MSGFLASELRGGDLMRRNYLISFFIPILLGVALGACSTRRGNPNGFDGIDAAPSDSGRDAGVFAPPDTGPRPDSGPPPDDVVVWAHSATELFSFNPRTLQVTLIGEFQDDQGDASERMFDLAVTRDGVIYTCGEAALYRVNPANAVVTEIATWDIPGDVSFHALSFIPDGSGNENLYGATNSGDYYRVALPSGDATRVGRYGNGFLSSGDIVSVEGAGTFATVKRDDYDTDVLARLNPTTGAVTLIGDGTGYRSLFGLGYWRNKLFGFSSRGELVDIDIDTGVGRIATTSSGTDQFWGAGVTTVAPVIPF